MSKNLTGDNIQSVLDNLLYRALEPFVFRCSIFDTQLVYILSRITQNKKRKLCSLDREQAMSNICKALVTQDLSYKLGCLSSVKIERNLTHRFIHKFLTEATKYKENYQCYLSTKDSKEKKRLEQKLKTFASFIGCDDFHQIPVILGQAEDFLYLYYKYRNSVVGHYVRMAYKFSKSYRESKTNYLDSKDVVQNFLYAIAKAIDKYDSSKGALTSYVNYWILNAQTCNSSSAEYGIAYTLPHSKKKKISEERERVNFSSSLNADLAEHDIPDDSDHVERNQEQEVLKYLIKKADINGCARLCLDIDEYFTKKELTIMKRHMKKQKQSQTVKQ